MDESNKWKRASPYNEGERAREINWQIKQEAERSRQHQTHHERTGREIKREWNTREREREEAVPKCYVCLARPTNALETLLQGSGEHGDKNGKRKPVYIIYTQKVWTMGRRLAWLVGEEGDRQKCLFISSPCPHLSPLPNLHPSFDAYSFRTWDASEEPQVLYAFGSVWLVLRSMSISPALPAALKFRSIRQNATMWLCSPFWCHPWYLLPVSLHVF